MNLPPPTDRSKELIASSAELQEVMETLRKFNPTSVFLYGSRARTDHMPESDYEIGVLFDEETYVGRSKLAAAIKKNGKHDTFSLYPLRLEEFLRGKPDTPFQKTIYMRELIEGGITLEGEKVIETMTPPEIKVVDLMQGIRFNVGYALAAVISLRNGDQKTAALEFAKSCLFGVRCLEILELQQFPLTYDEILELSRKILDDEYFALVAAAFNARKDPSTIKPEDLFKNISLLNKIIEPKFEIILEEQGNVVVLA